MKRRDILSLFAILAFGLTALSGNAVAQQAADLEAVKAASKAFYAALAVIDDGSAMNEIVAHTPYITFAGPRSKSVSVGYDAWKKYWAGSSKRFTERTVSLSDQHIHLNGNLAWEMGQESGTLKFTDGRKGKVDFIVTNVYEKVDGRWLMVSHHVQPKPK